MIATKRHRRDLDSGAAQRAMGHRLTGVRHRRAAWIRLSLRQAHTIANRGCSQYRRSPHEAAATRVVIGVHDFIIDFIILMKLWGTDRKSVV